MVWVVTEQWKLNVTFFFVLQDAFHVHPPPPKSNLGAAAMLQENNT
jgi:hypothetical protein